MSNEDQAFIEFLRLTIPDSKKDEFDKYIHLRMFRAALELIRESSLKETPSSINKVFQMPAEYDRHNRG